MDTSRTPPITNGSLSCVICGEKSLVGFVLELNEHGCVIAEIMCCMQPVVDLITVRQIRVGVVLPVEGGAAVDGAPQCQPRAHRGLHTLTV